MKTPTEGHFSLFFKATPPKSRGRSIFEEWGIDWHNFAIWTKSVLNSQHCFSHRSCHECLWKRPYPSVLHSVSNSTITWGKGGLHTGIRWSQLFTIYPYHIPPSYRKDTSFTKLLSWTPILIWHFATQLLRFSSAIFAPSKPYHFPLPTLLTPTVLHKYSSLLFLGPASTLQLTYFSFSYFSSALLCISTLSFEDFMGCIGKKKSWSQTLALCLQFTEQ